MTMLVHFYIVEHGATQWHCIDADNPVLMTIAQHQQELYAIGFHKPRYPVPSVNGPAVISMGLVVCTGNTPANSCWFIRE